MTNLFSTFDPQTNFLGLALSWNWTACFIPLIMIPQSYWALPSQTIAFIKSIFTLMLKEMSAVFGGSPAMGTIFWVSSYFFFILFSNTLGLVPYVFTGTSHLSMTLSLSLPLWLGSMSMSMIFQYNSLFCHLVPMGTPPPLMPVMVVIETVSNIIRPGTLAVRLAANMVAGHLLLSLLGGQGPALSVGPLTGLMVALILLMMLECAVACIQSYVFTILNALYLEELMSGEFNKKMLLLCSLKKT